MNSRWNSFSWTPSLLLLVVCAWTAGRAIADPPAATTNAATNLIVNGSFESPPVIVAGEQLWENFHTDELAPWQTDAPYFEVWTNGYKPANDDATVHYPPCNSADGGQNLEVISAPAYKTAIWQTVPTVAGARYDLSFYHTPRPGAHSWLAVYLNDDFVIKLDEDGSALTGFKWRQFSTNFVAATNATTVKFSDESAVLGQGTHLDGVVLKGR